MENAAVVREAKAGLFSRDYVLVCFSSLTFFGSLYLLVPTLPFYVLAIGGTEAQVGLLVGFFALSGVLVRPFVGREVDTRGRKPFIVGGALIFAVAALLYALATSVPLVLLLRFFHGFGIAGFLTASGALVGDIAPPGRRGEAMGYFGTAGNVAMALGPAIGVAIMQVYGFNVLFLIAGVTGAVSTLLALLIRTRRSFHRPTGAPAPLFVRATAHPAAIALCLSFGYGAIVSFVPLYAVQRGVGNPGFFFTMYALAVISTRLFSGRLSDRFGRRAVLAPGFAAVAVSLVVLALAQSFELLGLAAVLFGMGFGTVHPSMMALGQDRVKPSQRGAAMAAVGGSFDLGWGVGGVAMGFVLQATNFETMFLVTAVSAVAGLALLLVGDWRRSTP